MSSPPVESRRPGLRLSVVIPALNEAATLAQLVERVLATGCTDEIVIVDDGSNDGTAVIARQLEQQFAGIVHCLRHDRPRGKGAAVRTSLASIQGDLLLVQDADLEYDPADYPALLAPFRDSRVQAVYGSRNLRGNPRSSAAFYWGGRLLSFATNVLYGSKITDESSGYKVVRTALLRDLGLVADGFDFCPELTAKLLRRGVAIHEVPIAYRPRTFAQGKKIRWRDGVVALGVLVRERFARPKR